MAKQEQLPRQTFPELSAAANQHIAKLTDAVNTVFGYNGTIELNDKLDLGGNQVKNAAAPTEAGDLVTHQAAQTAYSAAALRPSLEAGGSSMLQSVRRIADKTQREPNSSFLNSTMSTPPNANTTVVYFSSPADGLTAITVPAGHLTFADGSTVSFAARTDVVNNPTTVAISSISVDANGVVTVVLSSAVTLAPGDVTVIAGVTTSAPAGGTTAAPTGSFNGIFTVVSVVSTTSFTYVVSGLVSASGNGGTLSTAGVYYYYVAKGSSLLSRIAVAATADSPSRRLATSTDNRQIVAVATVNASGGDSSLSAGGGTTTTGSVNAGSFF